MKNEFTIIYTDDENMEVQLDGNLIGYFNHDSHGWVGMESAEKLVEKIAHALQIPIIYK